MERKKMIILLLLIVCIITGAGFALSRMFSFTLTKRAGTGALDETYSSLKGNSPVIYEGIFPDDDEVQKMFTEIRGKPVFKNIPGGYHLTTLFYPKKLTDELYGTRVKLHVTSYQCERFFDKDFHLTGAEGVRVELECDDPRMQEYLDRFHTVWHITGSCMTEMVYTSLLNFDKGKPVDYTLEGVFGAYCTGNTRCFEKACLTGLENRWSRE